MKKLGPSLYSFEDCCTVYIVRSGTDAVLVDFGSGAVLDELPSIGVDRVTDVLVTHHHRDQVQGLGKLAGTATRIRVPHAEQDLFRSVDDHWAGRELLNMYNVREDRFSLLSDVEIHSTLRDYAKLVLNGTEFFIRPTPGHTPGSVSVLAAIDGRKVAFTGDLIAGPGIVWSMAATQWSYNGAEGVAASIPSLLDLKDEHPDILLPSHGEPMEAPSAAIDLLVARFAGLLGIRSQNPRLFSLHEKPYEEITPHVLMHRASMANCYVLRSDGGKALFLDFGYDFMTGAASGSDRASRRPWLHTIPALKRLFGIDKIDAVLPTHYHDDHVAGINLLREVEGARSLIPENFADILGEPGRYDLPCLWYDPVPADVRLPLGVPFGWEEFELTVHALPGHTEYACAIFFEADGYKFLVTGDQYQGEEGVLPNYVYRNRFHAGDFRKSAELYRKLSPDFILSGHWSPRRTSSGYFQRLRETSEAVERLHEELLPPGKNPGTGGFVARLEPYSSEIEAGGSIRFTAYILNPFGESAEAVCVPALPEGWLCEALENGGKLLLGPFGRGTLRFTVTTRPGQAVRRARAAIDVKIGGTGFGMQAEALVTTRSSPAGEAGSRDFTV